MNFFEHQDQARRKTKWLILYFLLAILLIIVAINALVYAALIYTQDYSPTSRELLQEPFWLPVSLGTFVVLTLGTVYKIIVLRGGGLSVARSVKARMVQFNTQDFLEKRLINVVEEMSIASGVPVPKLFVMDREEGINAFVAGIHPADTVMVVTKGALENLNREELQAVIGHEFSHINNSDMRINIRIMCILAGILLIGKVGEMIMRASTRSSSSRKNNASGLFVLVGLGVLLVGYIGLFFGRVIKAAISRQREYLADACSVQYTRYPQGLASAFRRMQSYEKSSYLNTSQGEDISHFCFGEALHFNLLNTVFATHPPLDKRIQAIDPNNQYDILPTDDAQKPAPAAQKAANKHHENIILAPLVFQVGNPTNQHFEYAKQVIQSLPEALINIVHDRFEVENLYYALLLNKTPELKSQFDDNQLSLIQPIVSKIEPLSPRLLMPLFHLSLPAFSELTITDRKRIFTHIESLSEIILPTPLLFTLITILGKRIHDIKRPTDQPEFSTLNALSADIGLLLSFIVKYSVSDSDKQDHCYQTILENLFDNPADTPPRTAIEQFKPIQFRNIIEKINKLTPDLKQKVLTACIELITLDHHINAEEAELITAIAECFDSPLPPVLMDDLS